MKSLINSEAHALSYACVFHRSLISLISFLFTRKWNTRIRETLPRDLHNDEPDFSSKRETDLIINHKKS